MAASPRPPLMTPGRQPLELSETVTTATEPFTLSWQHPTTSVEAIERALYALADLVSGSIAVEGDEVIATLYPRSTAPGRDEVAHRMRQEVIDQALRIKIAKRTDPIRNLVFALAFSNSGLSNQPAENDAQESRSQ